MSSNEVPDEVSRPALFLENVSEGALDAFKKLQAEITKDGILSQREKSIIAVACAVAARCEY